MGMEDEHMQKLKEFLKILLMCQLLQGEGDLVADLMEALKLIQAKTSQDPVRVHFAQGDEMAGMTSDTKSANSNFGG
ncbi:UNVERIFIED_CONTAM: hypothetical protein Slati_2777300 [Sesamum latifolium]|uniref:Uncharacterized protein n=1 Tax=Sesamum latifolium TaxID=2727402 RepID=A0AAW2W2S9_9LAMI